MKKLFLGLIMYFMVVGIGSALAVGGPEGLVEPGAVGLARAVRNNELQKMQELISPKNVNEFVKLAGSRYPRSPISYLVDGIVAGKYKNLEDCKKVLKLFLSNGASTRTIAKSGKRDETVLSDYAGFEAEKIDAAATKKLFGDLRKFLDGVDSLNDLFYGTMMKPALKLIDTDYLRPFKEDIVQFLLFHLISEEKRESVVSILPVEKTRKEYPKGRENFIKKYVSEIRRFYDGRTLQHEAAYTINSVVLGELLRLGFDANAKDENGETPLFSLVDGIVKFKEKSEEEIKKVTELLLKIANLSIKNNKNETVAQKAAEEELFIISNQGLVKKLQWFITRAEPW